eukprot:g22541.t1
MIKGHEELICVSLQHDDAGIRRLGLLKLLDFYGLPHFLQNLKVDPESKRTNCLKRLQPLESLPADGGADVVGAVEALLTNPMESPQVLKASMGLLAGLGRSLALTYPAPELDRSLSKVRKASRDGCTSNRIFLCQAVPGCIAWSTVTTFVPDYLHKEQGNKGHLAYLMAACTSSAVLPFLLLINSQPEALSSSDGTGAWPSCWALNVNTSATRGTVFSLVTLTDDVGKGLGPEVVAFFVEAFGRRSALSGAVSCWLLCAVFLYVSRWTIVNDVLRVERLEKLPSDAV